MNKASPSSLDIARVFVLVLLAATLPRCCQCQQNNAAEVTVCGAEGNATCLADGDRICISERGSEGCGNCRAGFLDLYAPENATCVNVTSVTWQQYLDFIDPSYRQDNETSEEEISERLERLHREMYEISELNARIPPLPFKLTWTDYTADTEEEEDEIRGLVFDPDVADEEGSDVAVIVGSDAASLENFTDLDFTEAELDGVPEAVNWVERGAVSPVRKQGRCACCWALTTVQAIESAAFITNGTLIELSWQQLISCDKEDLGAGLNQGCNGGWMYPALKYASSNSFGGITSNNEYPYTDYDGVETDQCLLDDSETPTSVVAVANDPVTVVSFKDDMTTQERIQEMKVAVSRQPVTIALKSECCIFTNYRSGILTTDDGCFCESPRCLDHGVLLVGYNDTHHIPYWLIKNSWGAEDWGEEGYVRIAQQGGGKWGLFGMLGVGIIPVQAIFTTPEAPPPSTTASAAKLPMPVKDQASITSTLGVILIATIIVGHSLPLLF